MFVEEDDGDICLIVTATKTNMATNKDGDTSIPDEIFNIALKLLSNLKTYKINNLYTFDLKEVGW